MSSYFLYLLENLKTDTHSCDQVDKAVVVTNDRIEDVGALTEQIRVCNVEYLKSKIMISDWITSAGFIAQELEVAWINVFAVFVSYVFNIYVHVLFDCKTMYEFKILPPLSSFIYQFWDTLIILLIVQKLTGFYNNFIRKGANVRKTSLLKLNRVNPLSAYIDFSKHWRSMHIWHYFMSLCNCIDCLHQVWWLYSKYGPLKYMLLSKYLFLFNNRSVLL